MIKVGFDVGGTFTDVVVIAGDGSVTTNKFLSLIDNIGTELQEHIGGIGNQAIETVVHGTTVASNAIIEGTTARTGYLTTQGFRDDLEMRGQRRPPNHDLFWDRSPPLVPRFLRLEVKERILGDGQIALPLDEADAARAIRSLLEHGVEAIAVCLINSYRNAAHENELGALVRRLAPNVALCLSSEVHPEIREYERASTTAINASLMPVLDRYLKKLETQLAPLGVKPLLMQSNGGVVTADVARYKPAYMIESGPAAGALAAARLSAEKALDKVLSFDMGGTTAKACLIEDGKPIEKSNGEVGAIGNIGTNMASRGGHALRVPSIDLVEVGAGGGSIAWIDKGGALRIGPQSAGASPGPVCYGRGGQKPTVTDANVVLGYINPGFIADGNLKIDHEAARRAIQLQLAEPLGIDVLKCAYGVTQVANSTMMRALRAVSTERGRDPREFTLVAFGGSGPVHAAALAEEMGIARVVIPLLSGLFSALGLLLAPFRHDYVKSVLERTDRIKPSDVMRGFDELETRAMVEMTAEGIPAEGIRFEKLMELKYGYQLQGLPIPFDGTAAGADLSLWLDERFNSEHETLFGYRSNDPVELVTLRLKAFAGKKPPLFSELVHGQQQRPKAASSREKSRDAYFGARFGTIHTPVLGRQDIDSRRAGPVIIEEPDCTIVVRPGWSVERDAHGSLCMDRQKAE